MFNLFPQYINTKTGRQLASCTIDDYCDYTFSYNDEGIRISKEYLNQEDTGDHYLTLYNVSGSTIISETEYYDNGGTWVEQHTLIYIYDENGAPIGIKYRTPSYASGVFDSYLFEKNLQGDIVAVYNASGIKITVL